MTALRSMWKFTRSRAGLCQSVVCCHLCPFPPALVLPRACRTQLCLPWALPGVSSPLSLPNSEQIHFSQLHLVGHVIQSHKLLAVFGVCPSLSLSPLCWCSQLLTALQMWSYKASRWKQLLSLKSAVLVAQPHMRLPSFVAGAFC